MPRAEWVLQKDVLTSEVMDGHSTYSPTLLALLVTQLILGTWSWGTGGIVTFYAARTVVFSCHGNNKPAERGAYSWPYPTSSEPCCTFSHGDSSCSSATLFQPPENMCKCRQVSVGSDCT